MSLVVKVIVSTIIMIYKTMMVSEISPYLIDVNFHTQQHTRCKNNTIKTPQSEYAKDARFLG